MKNTYEHLPDGISEEHEREKDPLTEMALEYRRTVEEGRPDHALFGRIWATSQTQVHAVAFSILGNEIDTEDVVQEVALGLIHKIQKFDGKSAFSTWLHRVVVNVALMMKRKKGWGRIMAHNVGLPATLEDRASTVRAVEEADEYQFQRALLDAAFAEIKSDNVNDELILQLADIQGLNNFEIAEIMQISYDAVKSKLHRARVKLHKLLALEAGRAA